MAEVAWFENALGNFLVPRAAIPSAAVSGGAEKKPPASLTLVKGNKTMVLADDKTRANPDAMRKAAKYLGIEAPKTRGAKSDQELLGLLRVEVNRRLAKLSIDDHVKCVRCAEIATDDTPFCPFCGDEGGPEVAAEVVDGIPTEVDEDNEEASVGIAKASSVERIGPLVRSRANRGAACDDVMHQRSS